MKDGKRHFIVYSFSILVTAATIIGCAAQTDAAPASRAEAHIESGTNRVYKRGGAYQLQTPEADNPPDIDAANKDSRAAIIADAVTQLEEISKSSVVITGNTAIVGIIVDGDLKDSDLIKIKERVEEKVKSTDRTIDHVSVTAADDMVKRISRMSDAGVSKKKRATPNRQE